MTELSGDIADEKCFGRLTGGGAAPGEPMDQSPVTSAAPSCLNCGSAECWREEVDIGVGIQFGTVIR